MDEKFLKSLDLPEESIPKILAEHTKELGAKVTQLQAEEEKLKTANQTIKDLQEAAKAFDGVDVKKLQEDMTTLQEKYDQDIAAMKLNHAIDLALASSQAKDPDIIRKLLDTSVMKMDGETLIGFDDQLEALKEREATKSLFEEKETPKFSGLRPAEGTGAVPDVQRDGFEARLVDARKNNNQLEVIKIKQEAAAEGVVLM